MNNKMDNTARTSLNIFYGMSCHVTNSQMIIIFQKYLIQNFKFIQFFDINYVNRAETNPYINFAVEA